MYVYILRSKFDGSSYVGMTSDHQARLKTHNQGRVKSTKSKVPWELVHLEGFDSRQEARDREKYFKSAAGRRYRKNILGL